MRAEREEQVKGEFEEIVAAAECKGGTALDVYRAVEWQVKAKRSRDLTQYFKQNYAKPLELLESAEAEESISEDSSREEYQIEADLAPKLEPVTPVQVQAKHSARSPIIRPSTPQRLEQERKMEELQKRMKEFEKALQTKDKQIEQLRQKIKDTQEETSQAAETANNAADGVAALAGNASVRTKTFIPKLVPYQGEKENIQLYVKRFENYATSLELSDDQQVTEFIANGRGPIENIVLTKDLSSWTIHQLKETVLERLSPNWDINRIEQELYKVKVELKDDPDTVMTKIERVLVKRDTELSIARLRQTQFNHFVRLIHVHEPMHTYVLGRMDASCDPDKALKYAREYLREKGNELTYYRQLVQQGLKDAGVQVKESETGIFPVEEPAASASATTTTTVSAPQTESTKTHVPTKTETTALQTTASAAQLNSEFVEQFVKRTDKLTTEQMNKRFNDLERLMKDLHVAGLPDFLKKKADQEKFGKAKSNESAPKGKFDKNRPRRGFERNKKGGEKTYKKKFVEKESGEIVAQYLTDESDEEETKSE